MKMNLKKRTSAILALMMVGTIFAGLFAATDMFVQNASAASGSFSGGNGTAGNPYVIEDVLDLQNVSADLKANYTLAGKLPISPARYPI